MAAVELTSDGESGLLLRFVNKYKARPPNLPATLRVGALPFTLGRRTDGQFQVTPKLLGLGESTGFLVSRNHATIAESGHAASGEHGYTIADAGTVNGTWLNGVRVQGTDAVVLQIGDIVAFGHTDIQYQLVPAAGGGATTTTASGGGATTTTASGGGATTTTASGGGVSTMPAAAAARRSRKRQKLQQSLESAAAEVVEPAVIDLSGAAVR